MEGSCSPFWLFHFHVTYHIQVTVDFLYSEHVKSFLFQILCCWQIFLRRSPDFLVPWFLRPYWYQFKCWNLWEPYIDKHIWSSTHPTLITSLCDNISPYIVSLAIIIIFICFISLSLSLIEEKNIYINWKLVGNLLKFSFFWFSRSWLHLRFCISKNSQLKCIYLGFHDSCFWYIDSNAYHS